MRRPLLLVGLGVFVLLFLALVTAHALSFTFNSPDYAVHDFFDKLNTEHRIHRLEFKGQVLRYVESGRMVDDAPLLFFVHGAPGNWDAFKKYMADYDLNQAFRMVSMDRPGYGKSDPGNAYSEIRVHAEAALAILENYSNREVYLVSHSYGGPVTAVMAARDSTISGLIMCAPVNDPFSEPELWYANLAGTSVFRFILPDYLNVAATEKLTHRQALHDILPVWDSISCPVLHYHGTDDALAPYEPNINFSRTHFDDSQLQVVTETGGGHLLIWFEAARFKELIISFVREKSKNKPIGNAG